MFVDIFNTTNKYKIILCDPPWTFKTYSDAGKDRSAEQHYSTMTLEDIKKLPVKNLADKDCMLFMWAIDTHLPQALDVIKAWDFTYKTTAFYWAKINKTAKLESLNANKDFFTGMGYWTRANPETCLYAENEADRCLLSTTGHPARQSASVRKLIIDYRREHSQKPDQTHDRIEQLLGKLPRIELFARKERDGWDSWGNEVNKFNDV